MNDRKIIIGLIIFGQHTYKYLPFFLPSLNKQTWQNFKVIAFNNGASDDGNVKFLRTNYPEIEIIGEGKNLGFAAAYNRLIRRAAEVGAEYFLMTNTDMIYEPDVLEKLRQRLESDSKLGSVSPKILKWDFKAEADRGQTDTIDTYGIALKSGLRFFNVGEGKKDDHKFSQVEIIGPSGASGLFRMSALEQVKENGQYLDERMFMYKEDCDLAYRLYMSGAKSVIVPEAVVYHDRTAAAVGVGDLAAIRARRNKGREIKRWSMLNQQLIFKKYWRRQNFVSKLNIVFYLLKSFFYSLFFEQYLLNDFLTIFLSQGKMEARVLKNT